MSKAVISAIVFRVNTWVDSRVSVGESGVSGGIGTLGSFGMVAQPWEFFSNVKLRLPPLEVQKPGFLSRQSREMDRHVVMSRENRGSS